MITSLLADSLTPEQSTWLLTGFGALAALSVTANQILGAIKNWRDNFGRKPSADEDLRAQREALDVLKLELKDLAPAEKVDVLLAKLAEFVTLKDFADAREEIRAI
jgi:hypothetical protein